MDGKTSEQKQDSAKLIASLMKQVPELPNERIDQDSTWAEPENGECNLKSAY